MYATKELPRYVHIVGICGVATSAVAIAFKKCGVKVTGSDKGFYPPVSDHLTQAGVTYYAGWHPENIESAGRPDFIMVGGSGTSTSNPEVIYANEHNIPIYAFAEVMRDYFIRPNSIVTVGTWGKTTTSSLLSFILKHAHINPSYFTGGLSLSHATSELTDSHWSVVEGDEYQTTISDKRPKFYYYSPTHLLLTSISWDHADLYPTEKAYFDTFTALARKIPETGIIVACIDDAGVREIIASSETHPVTYGRDELAEYRYHDIVHTRQGLSFSITYSTQTFNVHSPMLGRFNAENITGCFAMAHQINIDPTQIIEAITSFKGIKRRLEKRYEGDIDVLDCHAPTPDKARSILESIREIYEGKVIAVYEPNIGGRQYASAHMYDHAFTHADTVIIPRLTTLKVAENASDRPMEGIDIQHAIARTHTNVQHIDIDEKLVDVLIDSAKKDDVIAFLGSHGFRGMIEETVARLRLRK